MPQLELSQLSPRVRQLIKLIEFDDEEKILFEVSKHWFGLFMIYFFGFFVSILLIGLAAFIVLYDFDKNLGMPVGLNTQLVFSGLCLLATILVAAGAAIAATLYNSNVILVTSDKIAQLLNTSLFNRSISQLSIGDVQDVHIKQDGFFAHFFKYGTVVVETAGEQNNYVFTFVPNPYEVAKSIITSKEQNLKLYGN